jgi:3',5'-cyclic AMP phosphodiesterase CpdA
MTRIAFQICILLIVRDALAGPAIPDRAGEWRVHVGPAGNTYYEPPLPPSSETPEPSDAVLRWARLLTPEATIDKVAYRGDRVPPEFRVYAVDDSEEYRYYLLTDGTLGWMDYRNHADKIEESPNAIVPEGRKHPVDLDRVPAPMLDALRAAMPDIEPTRAWYADTLVGPRYIVQMGPLAFYGTPGGRIRCGGNAEGALAEVSAHATFGPVEGLSLDALGNRWGERFNFERLIQEHLSVPPTDGNFRYVVMGDCRDQRGLLDAMVAHIDGLEPKPAFVIVTGDAVRHGYAEEFDNYLLPALANTDLPYFIAIGNHDVGLEKKAEEFRTIFGQDSLNFYFDYGNSRFIFLDNCSAVTPWESALARADAWLAATPAGYRTYVSAHKPPANIEKWAYHAMSAQDSTAFTDLMAKHQVDEVYLGHIHAYSTATLDGVDYTLSGGAGAGLHGRFGPRGSVHHYVLCDASPSGVDQTLVRFLKDEE